MGRFLSVWSPKWPITRYRRQTSRPGSESVSRSEPFGLVETFRNARRLIEVNDVAEAAGLYKEQTVADALALEPALVVVDADREADRSALEALADWCVRFSPAVAVDPPDGLFLDVEGGAHLWGGEQGLLDDLLTRFAQADIPAQGAIADTAGAAWAVARWGGETHEVVPTGAARARLAPLPVQALRLSDAEAAGLIKLGIATIGQLTGLPRSSLSQRFGPGVRLRLDQALGEAREALAYRRAPAPYAARLRFFEPISAPEDLARVSEDAAAALCVQLDKALGGARRFELMFHRVDGKAEILRIGTALPGRDARRIAKLFAPKLETVDPGFGIEAVTLMAFRVEPLAEHQADLARMEEADAGDLAVLVDRLSNRLGEDRVWRPVPWESWLPERAVAAAAPMAPFPPDAAWPPDRPRPVRLFRRPQPIEAMALTPDNPPARFFWRGRLHKVLHSEGPERLAAEWWRKADRAPDAGRVRDYYRVEDEAGRRYWIFRAGLYGPDRTPRWFLHGLFG